MTNDHEQEPVTEEQAQASPRYGHFGDGPHEESAPETPKGETPPTDPTDHGSKE